MSITWDAPSISCGAVSYEVLVSQSSNQGNDKSFSGPELNDRSVEVTGLDNSVRDVAVTVTAIDIVGRRNESMSVLQLRMSDGKFV